MEWSLSLSVLLVLLHCFPGQKIRSSPSPNNSDPLRHSNPLFSSHHSNPLFSSHHSAPQPQLTPTTQPVSHADLIDGGTEVSVNSNQSSKHAVTEKATRKVLQERPMIDQIKWFRSTLIQAGPRSPNSQTTVVQEMSENEPVDKDLLHTGQEHTQYNRHLQANKSAAALPSALEHTAIQHQVGKDKHGPVYYGVFNSTTSQGLSPPGEPCVLGVGPCVVPTGPNRTSLLWEDLSRTLAFAWELHVFGLASLFLLLAVGAGLGMVGTGSIGPILLPHLRDSLTTANGILLLAGVLRASYLLIDPYGTRRILSRPVITALHNMPLTLLLWTQVALAPIALRRTGARLLPLVLQLPSAVRRLAALHCTLLLLADLLSSAVSPALSLLLQTLSLFWGLSCCLGVLVQSLSHVPPFLWSSRASVPQRGAPQRVEECDRRVMALCALLGVLCCGLQVYSLLWLYGLLGDWRQFGWGWWLGQFWARVLELAWGFSLLALKFWVLWRPQRSPTRGAFGQGGLEGFRRAERASLWETVVKCLRRSPFTKSEKNWAELMPNNWAGQHHSRADINISNFDSPPVTHSLGEDIFDQKGGPLSSSSSNSQAVLQQKVGERECILSLIEFDMRSLSPINLKRIDSVFNYGHLLGVGSLFPPPPPPSQTHNTDTDISQGGSGTTPTSPTRVSCRWALDAAMSPASPEHLLTKEDTVNQNPSVSEQ